MLDLSCRRVGADYVVHTDRWQRATGLAVCGATLGALAASCAEFLVHCVDAEGKRAGVDAHLVALLGAHSPLPAVYAGGAASLADLDAVEAAGGGRVDVTVGSALDLFGGGLRYDDVVAWHNARRGARGG